MKKIIYIFLMLILTLTINSRVFAATISTENIEENSSLVEVASVDNSKWRVVDYTNYTPRLTKSIDYSSNMNLLNY